MFGIPGWYFSLGLFIENIITTIVTVTVGEIDTVGVIDGSVVGLREGADDPEGTDDSDGVADGSIEGS